MDLKQVRHCVYKSSSVLVSRFFRLEQNSAIRKTPQRMSDEGRPRKRQFGQVGDGSDDMEVRSLRARCKLQEDQIKELNAQLQKVNSDFNNELQKVNSELQNVKNQLLTTTQKCQALEVENAGLKAQVDPFGVQIYDASPNVDVGQSLSDTSTSSSLALQVGSPPSGTTAATTAVVIPGVASATSPANSLTLSDDAPESLIRKVVAAASKPSGSDAK